MHTNLSEIGILERINIWLWSLKPLDFCPLNYMYIKYFTHIWLTLIHTFNCTFACCCLWLLWAPYSFVPAHTLCLCLPRTRAQPDLGHLIVFVPVHLAPHWLFPVMLSPTWFQADKVYSYSFLDLKSHT